MKSNDALVKNRPVISIVVLTCNRADMVVDLLKQIHRQSIISKSEVIVVNNGSQDHTKNTIACLFPDVKIVSLRKNIGCAGRNHGISIAKSQYVVTLDDDVFLHREDELERIIGQFKYYPDVAAINFKILFPHNKELIPFNWYHPCDYRVYSGTTFETDYISEGAVAFRRDVFEIAGYYPEDFFLSHEGPDLAYRILDTGKRIIYCGEIEVLHKCALQQRTSWRNTYYDTRNYFWLLYRHFPMSVFIVKSTSKLLSAFIFSITRRQLKWYLKALNDSFYGLNKQRQHRKVLKPETFAKISEIHRNQIGFFKKIKFFFVKISSQNKQY